MANVATIIPQMTFLLKIASISNLTNFLSPEVNFNGVPWNIYLEKCNFRNEESLSIYLHCGLKDNSADWSHVAAATFKIMPVSGENNEIDQYLPPFILDFFTEQPTPPHVFDSNDIQFGYPQYIQWKQLLKAKNEYVKDDTLTLEIKIEVPVSTNPSKLVIKNIKKSSDEGCLKKYQLYVSNIENLMAVKSPKFTMLNSTWTLGVQKFEKHLTVILDNRSPAPTKSCKVYASLKLVSSNEEKSIEPAAKCKSLKPNDCLEFNKIISWSKLLKPQNGFVNNSSIVIEVDFRASKPEGNIAKDDVENKNKPEQKGLCCSICKEAFTNQAVSTTECGHLFCTSCIEKSLRTRRKCPTCKADATSDSLVRLYLPTA